MTLNLLIEKSTRRQFARKLRGSGRREIGGILLGEQLEPGRFRLVNFSVDDITGSEAHFCRSPEQHGKELTAFFKNTGHDYGRFNYLGEWHSHPQFPVSPSHQDVASMMGLVRGEANIPFAALMIVRLDWWCSLKMNALMFSKHRNPELITIEKD